MKDTHTIEKEIDEKISAEADRTNTPSLNQERWTEDTHAYRSRPRTSSQGHTASARMSLVDMCVLCAWLFAVNIGSYVCTMGCCTPFIIIIIYIYFCIMIIIMIMIIIFIIVIVIMMKIEYDCYYFCYCSYFMIMIITPFEVTVDYLPVLLLQLLFVVVLLIFYDFGCFPFSLKNAHEEKDDGLGLASSYQKHSFNALVSH